MFVKIILSFHLSSNFTNISISFESLEKDSSLKCPIFIGFFIHKIFLIFFVSSSYVIIFCFFSHLVKTIFPLLSSILRPFLTLHYCWSIVTISQIATDNSILFVSLEKDLSLKCSIFDTLSYHHLSIPQFKFKILF